jgi:hypothetical protein
MYIGAGLTEQAARPDGQLHDAVDEHLGGHSPTLLDDVTPA